MVKFFSTMVLVVVSAFLHFIDAYSIHRYPPAPMGKYETMALWSHQYHRWVAVTPPDYAKVFLPTSGY